MALRHRGSIGAGGAGRRRLSMGAAFVRAFIKNPASTAAIAPSSRRLAERMVDGLDFARMCSVVEYGPGSGVFTRAVLERLPEGWIGAGGTRGALAGHAGVCPGRFIAIEFNPEMAEMVRERYPAVMVVADSAERVEEACREHGVEPGGVDVVISGLGFASFPPEVTTRILEATWRVLRPGGEFRTFAYHVGMLMPGAQHFRGEVRRLFAEVASSRAVWANLPPAFVYRCRKGTGKREEGRG